MQHQHLVVQLHHHILLLVFNMLYFEQQKLKKDISTAIAWGMPDNESIGYTNTELIRLLSRALKYIKYLESLGLAKKIESINDI